MNLSLSELCAVDKQYWLQHLVGPRPIALVSTVNRQGQANLSPFSFFNLFSIDPPILVFSPSRRVRDNTTKHTLENVLEIPEVVINMVHYDLVQQISLASCEYPRGVDEFEKAGLNKSPAHCVRPPLVVESRISFECKVLEVKPLGLAGGAGNLVICEVLQIHVKDVLTKENKVDPGKLDWVARLGDNWYARLQADELFTVAKPNLVPGIGIDGLPDFIRNSQVLTGNQLAQLANVSEVPRRDPTFFDDRLGTSPGFLKSRFRTHRVETYAAGLLADGQIEQAWQVLLTLEKNLNHV